MRSGASSAAALEEPEVGLGLRLAHGDVGRRVGAVAHVAARSGPAGTPARSRTSCSAAQVQQVGLVVLALRPAAVDHQDLEARDTSRAGDEAAAERWRGRTDRQANTTSTRSAAVASAMPAARRWRGWTSRGDCSSGAARAELARRGVPRARSGRGGLDADRAPVAVRPDVATAPPLGAAPDRTRRRPRARPRKPPITNLSSSSMSTPISTVSPPGVGARILAQVDRRRQLKSCSAPRRRPPCAKPSPGRQHAMRRTRIGWGILPLWLALLLGACARPQTPLVAGALPGWARHVPGEPSAEPRTDPAG